MVALFTLRMLTGLVKIASYELITYPKTQSLWTDTATVTITVIPLPVISSDDIAGPYMVGELQEFNVTLTNPANGATYTSLSASVFVDNITPDDFETAAEVISPRLSYLGAVDPGG